MVDRRLSHPLPTIGDVTISAVLAAPPDVVAALAGAIDDAKGTDPLAPVTVAVPTNTCGVMTRRALGRRGGVVGVDMVTLNRFAELLAGPELAAAGRSPMSTPVIDLAIASVLQRDAGHFASVASHPSTIVALRRIHAELRLAGPPARRRLAAESSRGRQVLRVSDAVTARLEDAWYDEADLYTTAIAAIRRGAADALTALVLHLPDELPQLAVELITALGARIDVRVVVQVSGPDDDPLELVEAIGATVANTSPAAAAVRPTTIVSTTDADDEVRVAARRLIDGARSGIPFERMALLWPSDRPYARLVEHHLTTCQIPWNGRPGTTVAERLAPRLVLDLLDVDRRGLRRRSLFDLLADVPARDADGRLLPTASWERVSRAAGIARDDDWEVRLRPLTNSERWSNAASSLHEFVQGLRGELGKPGTRRSWSAWSQWCSDQVEAWLGRHTIERLPESEYRAWEALTAALDRLSHLDAIGEPVTRHRFRSTLEAELDAAPAREGRVGNGVTVGPLAGATGLDIDLAVILGCAEGVLPPPPTGDPLLTEDDRALARLPTADARARRLQRVMWATLATADVTVTYPRGDLRATSGLLPSRWIAPWLTDAHTDDPTDGLADGAVEVRDVPSHHAGLAATTFPASRSEHRLRAHHHAAGARVLRLADTADLADLADTADTADPVLARGLTLLSHRRSDRCTPFDGDLSGAGIPPLSAPVSPSRLEAWVACPHAYFVHYLLEVDPIEEPGDEISISARDRGSAQHQALDVFHRRVVEGDLPQPGAHGWSAEHRQALVDAFDAVCAHTERRGRTGRRAFWADERTRMQADLLGWLDRDSELVRQRGSVVLASEMRFGIDDAVSILLPDGRPIALHGSIDRVDRTRDGSLVVTDHKSGAAGAYRDLAADDPTAGGTRFQLPSYAAAARARFGTPDTPVHAEYGLMRKGDYARPGYLLTADVDRRVAEALAAIVAGIEEGWFPNRPARPGFRFWVSCEYCEPDHLGTAERWAEWERKQHDPRLAPWFGPIGADA
jgi:ATP-dependent helicase/nuclease subunit B